MILNILDNVGNTPLIPLKLKTNANVNILLKLEYLNPTGSVKDRAASYILDKILKNGIINRETEIIESSSGNFGVALSAYTKLYGLKFTCVIDNHTLPGNEMLIKSTGAKIIKITKPDENGGYLLNRIGRIKEILRKSQNMYWVNQYENKLNSQAYYDTLGQEICHEAPGGILHYVFLGVSSGGTITGVSKKVKEKFPNVKVIAVDILGSVIFGQAPRKRLIPGIGSSMRPKIIEDALIDDVIWVSETDTVKCCRELLNEYSIYAGGSSGSIYAGIKKYFESKEIERPINVMSIVADRGERYITTIYNDEWYSMLLKENQYKENILL